MDDKTKEIAKLNDSFRMKNWAAGKVYFTRSVTLLTEEHRLEVINKVMQFNDFTEDNDPYHEHDFGAFKVDGTKYFWKIDYYRLDMAAASEEPSDPKQTQRVLTIMRADEY